jgi:hypothetical protein
MFYKRPLIGIFREVSKEFNKDFIYKCSFNFNQYFLFENATDEDYPI